jgi:divalent metal cation (Fe/Co/Zn/Cd) transporter
MTIEPAITATERVALVERGRLLSRVTLAYNAAEGAAAIVTGALAGSVALMGFGIDSVIEVVSSMAALRRLGADADAERRAGAERFSMRIIGVCFLALSLYIVVDAGHALLTHEIPGRCIPGIIVATLSVVIMPLLARAKRRVAVALGSRALNADATQTDLCMYLSAIVLGGLVLNALFGWWWADPIAALLTVPIIAREGFEALRGEEGCDECS